MSNLNSEVATPKHLRPAWQKLAARLQSEARFAANRETTAVITVKILVDTIGNPIKWTRPHIIYLEPRPGPGEDCLEELLDLLT